MAWSLLHKFKDGVAEVASGAQVTEVFEQVREKIEAIEGLLGSFAKLGTPWATLSAELGFGPLVVSATRPSFVIITTHKAGNAPILAIIKVNGAFVGEIADGEYGVGFTMARSLSVWLPPGASLTLESPNLAAIQPVTVTGTIL